MSMRFAINGFGRIGRALSRVVQDRPELELVAVNDLGDAATLARLLAFDSVHGRFAGRVEAVGGSLQVDGRKIAVFQQADPGVVPWHRCDAEVVVEATGLVHTHQQAARHLGGSVGQVLVSGLLEDPDLTLCPGLGLELDATIHRVISAASCTTHALALLLKVLHDNFGVRHALMNEVHSYTGNQRLLDGVHQGAARRERAAAVNIVPTTTAAPRALERLFPALAGRLAGQAVRVPTPDVALLDLVFSLEQKAGPEQLDQAFLAAAADDFAGLLAVTDEPLVSTDFIGDPHSAVVDRLSTCSLGGELHRIVAWYDNEWGYANRLADFLTVIGEDLS